METEQQEQQKQKHPYQLYQLELVVKTVTRCDRLLGDEDDDDENEDWCDVTIDWRLAGQEQEQTVCHVPAVADRKITRVDRGQTYTFPGPTRVDAGSCVFSLYVRRQSDRVQIASGQLEVPLRPRPHADDCPRPASTDEQMVAMTARPDGRTVAVLAVRARAWLAGQMVAAGIAPKSPSPDTECCRLGSPRQSVCRTPGPPAKAECCTTDPLAKAKCCGDRSQKAATATPTCRRDRKKKSAGATCCAARRTCRRRYDVYPTAACPDVPVPRRQYSTIRCEFDGRQMDLRIRKKNPETCAVQRKIADKENAFTARVMTMVQELQQLVTTTMFTDLNGDENDDFACNTPC